MKMVAASKLRRAQESAVSSRPFSAKLKEVLSRLVTSNITLKDPLLETRPVNKVAYVVITSDRGLAGGYSINAIKEALTDISQKQKEEKEIAIVPVGRKGRDYFRRRGYELAGEFVGMEDLVQVSEAQEIARKVRELYTNEGYDEVYLVFTKFITAMQQCPTVTKLLPIEPEKVETDKELDYLFEPNPEIVLNQLLPMYLQNQIFEGLMEAKASEHGSRMTAMDSATNNANDMLEELDLSYNRARQAAITNEISEIVGGANALQS